MDEHIQDQNRSAPADETQEVLQPGDTRLSWSQHDEEELRKRAFVRLGVVLLIGFLMPMGDAGHGSVWKIFVNIRALGEEGVPPLAKLFFFTLPWRGLRCSFSPKRPKGSRARSFSLRWGLLGFFCPPAWLGKKRE